jgi:hypothetical protein
MPENAAQRSQRLAKERRRRRVVWLWVLGIPLALAGAIGCASMVFAMGVVWGSASNSTQFVRVIALENWKCSVRRVTSTGNAAGFIGLHPRVVRRGTPLWTDPPGMTLVSNSTFSLPLFFLVAPLAGPMALIAHRISAAEKRRARGCCPECGYDLRRLEPTDGVVVCPECGRAKRRRGAAEVVVPT